MGQDIREGRSSSVVRSGGTGMKIFVAGMGRINTRNRDGGEIRLIEMMRRWVRAGHEVHFLLPEREHAIVKSEVEGVHYHVLTDIFRSESHSIINVLSTYAMRLVQVCLFRLRRLPRRMRHQCESSCWLLRIG